MRQHLNWMSSSYLDIACDSSVIAMIQNKSFEWDMVFQLLQINGKLVDIKV